MLDRCCASIAQVRLQIHTVGPIDVSDSIGKEVVARLQCDVASAATMFTDSNGREMIRRVRNVVPTWNMSAHDPVAVNFYPVTSAAYIQDSANRMCPNTFAFAFIIPTACNRSLLPDRTMGMASLSDGAIEYALLWQPMHRFIALMLPKVYGASSFAA
jgi:lysosomal alpha-mannosidase